MKLIMYNIRYFIGLMLALTGALTFAQSNNAPAMSQKASICVKASETAFLVVMGRNDGRSESAQMLDIDRYNLPVLQKNNLFGLIKLLYSPLVPSSSKFDEKGMATNYYLSCMTEK